MIRCYKTMGAEWPEHRFFYTLDHYGQACYTSGHSIDKHDLDAIEGHNLSNLPATSFEDGKHIEHFGHPLEFPLRHANLLASLEHVGKIDEEMVSLTGHEFELGFDAIQDDITNIVDDECYLVKVPVNHAYEVISAFPNGYFSGDLSPQQVYFHAKFLEEQFGYTLFGIGASLLSFIKSRELAPDEQLALISYLTRLYSEADINEHRSGILNAVCNHDLLTIGYAG